MSDPALEIPVQDRIRKIIPIHPGSKYVILLPEGTPDEDLRFLAERLTKWWSDDAQPFLIMGGTAEFVKMVNPVEIGEGVSEQDEPETES